MPYKFNEGRRHKFSKARYRVTNWPDYDAALVRWGELTVWLTEQAMAAWYARATGERGGQPIYSAIAIETALTLRLVFHQPLRQTEGLLRSIAALLDIDIAIRYGGGPLARPERGMACARRRVESSARPSAIGPRGTSGCAIADSGTRGVL
jgi:hypothetical protein